MTFCKFYDQPTWLREAILRRPLVNQRPTDSVPRKGMAALWACFCAFHVVTRFLISTNDISGCFIVVVVVFLRCCVSVRCCCCCCLLHIFQVRCLLVTWFLKFCRLWRVYRREVRILVQVLFRRGWSTSGKGSVTPLRCGAVINALWCHRLGLFWLVDDALSGFENVVLHHAPLVWDYTLPLPSP